jgi:hypothetical protein
MTLRRISVAVLMAASIAPVAEAYLKFAVTVDGSVVTPRWSRTPVRYFVNDAGVPEVSGVDLQAAVSRAARSWEDVATSAIAFEFGGFTGAGPVDEDGITTVGFQSRPDLPGVLGATELTIDVATGALVEADIFLNSQFVWSVSPGGRSDRFDVESIVLHELGHLLGLSHSGIGETETASDGRRVIAAGAVMFPIAFSPGSVDGRRLQRDDVAGASDLYPDRGFSQATGSLSGRVVSDGRGVLGAHVLAFHLESGVLVGGFTINGQGEFAIAGLDPGPHVIRVEPIDDADVDSFFGEDDRIDTGFRAGYLDTLVFVRQGGHAGPVEIRVNPR